MISAWFPKKVNTVKKNFTNPSMYQRMFLVFLCVHFLLWTILPLLKTTMHPDSIEAINWGMIGGWVNDKHPPLSGFLADFFWRIGGRADISIYILAQICMIATFVFVYRLGRLIFKDEKKAIISAVLLEGVLYYTMTASDQFNCNIVSVPLWAMTTFYVYRGATQGGVADESRLKVNADWIFAGVVIGLNMLDKYSAAFQVVGIGAYMVFSRAGREQLRRPWPYIGGLIAAAIFAPHVYALYKSDFVSLSYLSLNLVDASKWWLRWTEPIRFVLSLIAAGAGAIVIYFISARGAKTTRRENRDAGLFLSIMIFVPIAAMIMNSVISNLTMASMWGIPFLFLIGIGLAYFFPRVIGDEQFKRIVVGCYVVMAIFAAANLGKYIFNNGHRIHFDHSSFVADIGDKWANETGGAPLKFVRGDTWFASILSVYHAQHPRNILNIDKHYRRELNSESLEKYGLLIVGVRERDVIAPCSKSMLTCPFGAMNIKIGIWRAKHATIICFT